VSFDKDFNFQLLGTAPSDSNSYVAAGLSFDSDMVWLRDMYNNYLYKIRAALNGEITPPKLTYI